MSEPKKPDTEFTTRVLMTMATEIAALTDTAEQLRLQFEALAKEYGVAVPKRA